MFINTILNRIQMLVKPVYDKSFVLQNIDWLIGINIFLLIFASTFAQSDNIGYFALFIILLSSIKLLTKQGEKFELLIAEKFLLIYFIFVLISVFGSSLFALSLKGFFKTLTYLGFYVSVVHYLKEHKNMIKYIFISFVLCTCYETIFAFLQNFGAVEEISGWQDMSRLNPEEIMTRVYGTLKPLNPNLFGGYMLAVIPTFIPFVFINRNSFKKTAFTLIAYLLAIIALILTGCRGAYVGLFLEIAVLIIFIYKFIAPKFKKLFSAFLGICVCIISFIIITISSLRARIFSIFAMRNDSSNSFRFNVYNSCIHMFKDNWLLGIGCGNQNFREIYGLYMKTGFDALSAYNIYLETAVESGIFALLFFVCFIVINILNAIKYILKSNNIDKIYVLAVLVSLIGILAHGFVDTVFFRPQIQFTFWIMLGILRTLIK